jgi:Flp pilus assembly protein TadG
MMNAPRNLRNDRSGQAAAEMALVMPILLILMFGAAEVGHYFYQEHIVVDAVRDGARYAARQSLNDVNCAGVVPGVETSVRRATRLVSPNAADTAENRRIFNWDDDNTVTVSVACAENEDFAGLYVNMNDLPRVRVEATVPYNSLFSFLGFGSLSLNLVASSEAAWVGA